MLVTVGLWENRVFCGCEDWKCTVRAWTCASLRLMGLKVFLESPVIFPVSEQGSVETAGKFIPCCSLQYSPGAASIYRSWAQEELYFCFLLVHTGKSGMFCSGLLVVIDPLWQVGQLGLGFTWEAQFYLAEGLRWAAGLLIFYFGPPHYYWAWQGWKELSPHGF